MKFITVLQQQWKAENIARREAWIRLWSDKHNELSKELSSTRLELAQERAELIASKKSCMIILARLQLLHQEVKLIKYT